MPADCELKIGDRPDTLSAKAGDGTQSARPAGKIRVKADVDISRYPKAIRVPRRCERWLAFLRF